MNPNTPDPFLGTLLGTAVGDSLGLPYEGLARRRVAAFGEIRHRLLFGRGMFSDDTEHTLMLGSTLLSHHEEVSGFQRAFAWKLRWWLLALPAGVGLGTAKAILRLWMGFPASKAGVRSAGNGAAMRSAVIGVFFRHDPQRRREFAIAACHVTHRDPRAEESAILVVEAAAMAAMAANAVSNAQVVETLEAHLQSGEMKSRFAALKNDLAAARSVSEFTEGIGCGKRVSGFAPDTVAVALYAWLRHRGDFESAVRSVITCGGDTDTVAAITGGICGAETDESSIPQAWIDGILDWPRSVAYLRRLAEPLSQGAGSSPSIFWPFLLPRNLLFLVVVLLHGFRRFLPPY